jgi:hypothetical protein
VAGVEEYSNTGAVTATTLGIIDVAAMERKTQGLQDKGNEVHL